MPRRLVVSLELLTSWLPKSEPSPEHWQARALAFSKAMLEALIESADGHNDRLADSRCYG